MDYLRLVYAYVTDAIGDAATVEMQTWGDSTDHLPLVVAGVSAPVTIPNGPRRGGASFDIVLSCYATGITEAYDLALLLERRLYDLYSTGHVTDHGGIAHISAASSTRPERITSDLEADDSVRFDLTLAVTARPSHTT